ncbi:SDR family oxidoreductase [Alkalihalobacillus oceani]|uniref:elongation factor P 5-aminopentanone reductase n=1 Tax=Halalkalibacter oceani TaxID=1653776 RepID=UPI0020423468|nr:SDR family NAD(P)-dependent oxidoreductase [Halalkalibacter oceani]MCM3759512.1 SDR family oxidoreductase [Halalkalibacter oceani]
MRKQILLTGASGGIGQAIARELAAPGCSLFLHYATGSEKVEAVGEVCRQNGAEVTYLCADLTREDGDEQLLSALPSYAAIDTIIHNAGTSYAGLFTEMTKAEIGQVMNIHLLNPMHITKALLPGMLSRQAGNIIVISSIWGQTGAACEVAYSAAKSGLNGFVKGLAKEVAPSGIQVNGIAPGAIETEMLNGIDRESLIEDIPANRLGQPEEVAATVSFLTSGRATYINGHILSVNGAWHC